MKGGSAKKVICGAVLGISVFFTAIGFFSNIDSKKDFTHYSVSPLIAKSSRAERLPDERKADFEGLDYESEDMRIYEVHIEFENVTDYTWKDVSFMVGTADGGYAKIIYPEGNGDWDDAERNGHIVPAGRRGTIVCYVAAEPDTSRVMLEEYGELLDEDGNRAMVNLPAEVGEVSEWSAE